MSDETRIGTVQDVTGGQVSVTLDVDFVGGMTFVRGHGYFIGQVGSFVRIPLGLLDLFGVVTQVGAGAVPEKVSSEQPFGRRWMTIELVGEALRGANFRRGISRYPVIGDAVHIVTRQGMELMYGGQTGAQMVRFGSLASAESLPALVNVDRLVTRHSAVVGSTGSGKSTAVSRIIDAISDPDRFQSARILVLDLHGEYAAALGDRASVYRVSPRSKDDQPLYVPYWALTFDELVELTLGSLEDASLATVLQRIVDLKRETITRAEQPGVNDINLTVDSPVPFSIHRLWYELLTETISTVFERPGSSLEDRPYAFEMDEAGQPVKGDALTVIPPRFRAVKDEKGDAEKIRWGGTLNLRRPLERLGGRLRDNRLGFVFSPGPWLPKEDGTTDDDLGAWLETLLGSQRPVTILDLSGIPSSILNLLVGALLRTVYDALFWARNLSEGGRERPLLIVLEEAHTYLQTGGTATSAIKRVVKEGRKYGIGAMIVTQRPSEVDSTILSQCGTLFSLRLTNASDRSHVSAAAPESLGSLMAMLPALRTGEVLVVGEAVTLPVRAVVDFPPADRRPDSSDPLVYEPGAPGGWNRKREPANYSDVAEVWRAQDPASPRVAMEEESHEEK